MTRPSVPSRRRRAAVAAACAGVSFLVTVAYAQSSAQTGKVEARRRRLAALVVDRQRRNAGLEHELAVLRSRLRALVARSGAASIEAQVEGLSVLAGTSTVAGHGVTVTMSDSPSAGDAASPDFLIQDVDVQLVVNQLWLDGAEAIAVNGQRIVSTTAIRSAGRAILVNYKVLTSPYRIDAIGNPRAIHSALDGSDIAQRFRTWQQVYRLSMKIDEQSRLVLPPYRGRVHASFAEPAASPSPSPRPAASPKEG